MIVHFLSELIGDMMEPIISDIPNDFENEDNPLAAWLKPDRVIDVHEDFATVMLDLAKSKEVEEVTVFSCEREDIFLFFSSPDGVITKIPH